ncbi:MAG: hypothetical protein Solumvirus2_32 [Solumvirus sp.]|uniref:DRBM domain-containing protein n=1 Tax=Solumvirus sp. TaxID=2487773 RepID=A0A3G5AG88_9VIRU|nr:MAG: hypothetical protein Solumvirus2_32 [Solumvirus sp.]
MSAGSSNNSGKPAKTELQEWCMQQFFPKYVTKQSGPSHMPNFTSIVSIGGIDFTGEGKTRIDAENSAAKEAIIQLNDQAKKSKDISTDEMLSAVGKGVINIVKSGISASTAAVSAVADVTAGLIPNKKPDSVDKKHVTFNSASIITNVKDGKHSMLMFIDGLTTTVTITDAVKNPNIAFAIFYPKDINIPSDVPTKSICSNVEVICTGVNHSACSITMVCAISESLSDNDHIKHVIVGKSDQCSYMQQVLGINYFGTVSEALNKK